MDKYEYRVKTEQMLEYMEKRQHKKAVEIADTIDWKRVKNVSMLNTVSEIYEQNGEFVKSRDILLMAFDRSPGSRKIAYRLGILALKVNDVDEGVWSTTSTMRYRLRLLLKCPMMSRYPLSSYNP